LKTPEAPAALAHRGACEGGEAIVCTVTRLSIDPIVPDRGAIEEAARAIRAGGIVALPTDTLYGLAVDPFNAEALAAVRRLKQRPAERAVPLVAADVEQIAATLGVLPMLARLLAVRFWPGPLTMLMQAPEHLPADVTGGTGGTPLTATSANKSGQPATNDPETVAASLGTGLGVLLDAGVTRGGPPSTIIDVTDATPRVIRQGAIPWESIQACLGL
jgi:L-threonylcarbamoyladenylate synthase